MISSIPLRSFICRNSSVRWDDYATAHISITATLASNVGTKKENVLRNVLWLPKLKKKTFNLK